jgi:hypothetical protein
MTWLTAKRNALIRSGKVGDESPYNILLRRSLMA